MEGTTKLIELKAPDMESLVTLYVEIEKEVRSKYASDHQAQHSLAR